MIPASFDLSRTPIEDGVTVIEASAGTGKTYCLTGLVLRLLLERRVEDVSQLLVVTFTQAATQELAERLRGALGQICRLLAGEKASDDPFLRHLADAYRDDGESLRLVREAVVRFDDLTVSTLHGFCRRVLADGAFESGLAFESELLENDAPLLLEAARDVWRRQLYPASALITGIAAEEGWLPETFLADYQAWRSHPQTEILPPPEDFDVAGARLEQAFGSLRQAWDLGAVRTLLATRRFRSPSLFGRGARESELRAADAFCREGRLAGLAPVRELAWGRLEAALYKRDARGVEAHPVIRACSAFAAAIDVLSHAFRGRFIREVDALFAATKRDTQVLTYDDLLRRLRDALADPRRGRALAAAVRQHYRAALIDEFQDTDLIQYDIFRRLFKSGPLFLIGDPKQAIYRFRGADVFAYLAARDEADRTYTLDRNWRAAEPLVEAVNAVFGAPRRPFVFARIAFEPIAAAGARGSEVSLAGDGRPPLQWLWVPRLATREESRAAIEQAVAREIVRLLTTGLSLSGRPLAPGDIAVLVRTNDQAQTLQDVLRTAGVPSVVGRAGDVFQSEEMTDLERLLTAIADPGYGPRLRAAWATRLWGNDARAILELNRDDEANAFHLERFAAYRDDWRQRGFMPMIQTVFAERRVRRRLLETDAGERRLTNLLHAVEILHRAQRERHLSPAALLTWLASERGRQRTETGETELRLESDAPAVQISTVHRSKGLEYEIVFCPYLFEARPVDGPPAMAHLDPEHMVFDCGSDKLAEHLALAEAERLGEDLRLTYVALTRARQRCYVAWGDVPGQDGPAASALGYLLRPTGRRPEAEATAFAVAAAPGPSSKWAAQALAEVKAGREGWRHWLENLTARHGEIMELRSLDGLPPAPLPEPAAGDGDAPRPRVFQGSAPLAWSFESFSSLSRAGGAEAPDYRDPATPEALRPPAPAPVADPPATGIAAFARGRRAGTCLHHILEHCDFSDLAAGDVERRIADALSRHGLDDPRSHLSPSNRRVAEGRRQATGFDPAAAVHQLLHRLAAATLPGTDFSLSAVPASRTLVEWRFTTPLARVSPRRLADVFRAHARGTVRDDYAGRVERLSAAQVRGYLVGFVDLIFTHGERWYLIDWKSNDLGPSPAAYRRESLWQPMAHHHYVLQYHLYLVALHRYLRQRLPDYDYERHVAGAYYVFLRGLTGDGDATDGWFVDRPPLALISALDALIEGRAAA